MKSFTVTFHHTHNYGATLQAYALQHYLETIGVENQIMEYVDIPEQKTKSVKQMTVNAGLKVLGIIRKRKIERAKASFKKFHEEYMKFSRPYIDSEDLRKDPPEADVLITGSDQVWNLKTNPITIPARFLDFGSDSAIRFSYAASIGRLDYNDEQKNQINRYLKKFKGISLRESTAAKYISDFSGQKCFTVVDPVFLLSREDWNSIAVSRKEIYEPYILCYFVQGNERIREVVNKIKLETGYKVVAINCGVITRVNADMQLFDVSPQEFLGLYSKAAIVVTTSFHGTAFALVYGKPVYSFVKGNWDNRISDLMNKVGLSDYVIQSEKQIPNISYETKRVQNILNQLIGESKEYVQKMIFE